MRKIVLLLFSWRLQNIQLDFAAKRIPGAASIGCAFYWNSPKKVNCEPKKGDPPRESDNLDLTIGPSDPHYGLAMYVHPFWDDLG